MDFSVNLCVFYQMYSMNNSIKLRLNRTSPTIGPCANDDHSVATAASLTSCSDSSERGVIWHGNGSGWLSQWDSCEAAPHWNKYLTDLMNADE